ncbi:hypothetical protein AAHE18_19G130100 [Arachis hypogaea]
MGERHGERQNSHRLHRHTLPASSLPASSYLRRQTRHYCHRGIANGRNARGSRHGVAFAIELLDSLSSHLCCCGAVIHHCSVIAEASRCRSNCRKSLLEPLST